MATSSLYRRVLFQPDRILESRELNTLQDMMQEFRDQGLGEIIVQGAPYNITATPSGSNLVLSATNNDLPMMVFVDGRFEIVSPGTLSYDPGKTSGTDYVYLNWALTIITSVQDPTLVDSVTDAPTANMGEFDASLSATDSSGVALDPDTQYAKNTSPIQVFALTRGSGGSITVNTPPLFTTQMLANTQAVGAVTLTTNTSGGVAVSTDDSRMSDARDPKALSVYTPAVAVPVTSGATVTIFTNTDNSTETAPGVYAVGNGSQTGGISSDGLIYSSLSITVTSMLDWIKTKISSLYTTWAGHIGEPLGEAETHPMPTASDVGATPASHQNLALGVAGSHPPLVTSDTGGFQVQSNTTSPSVYAYSITGAGGSGIRGGITYDGDIQSTPAAAFSVASQLAEGTFSGPVANLSAAARALTDHVNLVSHGNPHGLALSDLGGATTSYVDTSVAGVLASAEAYTNTAAATTLSSAETYADGGLKILDTGTISDSGVIAVPTGYVVAKCELILSPASLLTVRSTGGSDDLSTIQLSYTKNSGSNQFAVRCYWQSGGPESPHTVAGTAGYIMIGSKN